MSKIPGVDEVNHESEEMVRYGLSLCESTVEKGGWADYFSKEDGTDIEDRRLKAGTAVMLENTRKWLHGLDESTLALTVGGWRDYLYPIVRAVFPNNPINDLVSVQPQSRKNGTIMWLNYTIGQSRGKFKRGETLFDANVGWQGKTGYTDNKVYNDALGVTEADNTTAVTLSEVPAVAGAVEITVKNGADTYVLRDNGNGALTKVSGGALTVASGTVNYMTGAVAITWSAALTGGDAITASYETNTEGQYPKAQIDFEIQTAPVVATRRTVGVRISMESIQDANAEVGLDARSMIVTAASQQLMADVGGEVITDLWDMAGPANLTFSLAVPAGINKAEHIRDLNFVVQEASGQITDATQRGSATWMIVDQKALNVLAAVGAAGGFNKAGDDAKGQGLVYVGDYNGIRVYRWKYLNTLSGASANGNILVGYKGADWWDTGYVYSVYQQFYTNGPDDRADLTSRQTFAMRYGKKSIAKVMYRKIALIP